MRTATFIILTAAFLYSAPSYACDGCPQVELLRAEDQVRIVSQDDHDVYEDLRHRVRFVSQNVTTAWSDWSDAGAYAVAPNVSGGVEAESVDLDGNVGRGIIYITAPTRTTAPRGPSAVQEDSSVEARWDGVNTNTEITAADLPDEQSPPPAAEFLSAEDWDHTVCPAPSADADLACTTSPAQAPRNTALAFLLLFVAALLVRNDRRVVKS